jgi:hypothetical protein
MTGRETYASSGNRETLLRQLGHDRIMAHQVLFRHRHPDATPPFHDEIINIWHAADPAALVMVFREGGKSTIAEEAFVVGAGFQLFHNALIIGSTEKRSVERLRAIKHEIEHNEMVAALFGELFGPIWNEAEIILANGVRIIAVGRGQSLRGTKHLHWRPDFCFCDDIEEEENVRTPEARAETLSWFMSTVVPALDVNARIRVNATPLDREALPYKIQHELRWPTRVYPIEHVDSAGVRQPTWPARYPLGWIDKRKEQFANTGRMTEYMREYMCIAEDPERRILNKSTSSRKPMSSPGNPCLLLTASPLSRLLRQQQAGRYGRQHRQEGSRLGQRRRFLAPTTRSWQRYLTSRDSIARWPSVSNATASRSSCCSLYGTRPCGAVCCCLWCP